ncbi:MAG: TraR/DksA C4-type zinc finger protein [Minwuia sp.]|nr:TraR/DksA C4-type zinc finger protein [Minwuia sp.]
MSEHEDIRQQLIARKAELLDRLHRFEDELDTVADPDSEERAVQREGDEAMERLGLTGQKEIEAIDAALKRFADGSFGLCVGCGERISPERLALLPQTPFCKVCVPQH